MAGKGEQGNKNTGYRKALLPAVLLLAAVLSACMIKTENSGSVALPETVSAGRGQVSAGSDFSAALENGSVTVTSGGKTVWTSPPEYSIVSYLKADVDRDGSDELLLLLDKKGKYGPVRPFWVDAEEGNEEISRHIFIYRFEEGTMRSIWGASELGVPVTGWRFEKGKGLYVTDANGKETLMIWKSWGLEAAPAEEPEKESEGKEGEIRFLAVGDALIHRNIYQYALDHGDDFGFLFTHLEDRIRKADLASINQETVLVEDPSLYGDYPLFGTPVSLGKAIRDAGFDVVSGATNHVLDRGMEGISTETAFYESCGIPCVGIQSPGEKEHIPYRLAEKNGIRVAFLGFTYGTNGNRLPEGYPETVQLFDREETVRADLRAARAAADAVIVFAHWGTEYASEPDGFQQKWAEIFLEEGVDAVIGTHPHVGQPAVRKKRSDGHEMVLYYSLGNYVAAQQDIACNVGGMAEFAIRKTENGIRITDASLEPLIIHKAGGYYTVYALSEYPDSLAVVRTPAVDPEELLDSFPSFGR